MRKLILVLMALLPPSLLLAQPGPAPGPQSRAEKDKPNGYMGLNSAGLPNLPVLSFTPLDRARNLSDLDNITTARTNLQAAFQNDPRWSNVVNVLNAGIVADGSDESAKWNSIIVAAAGANKIVVPDIYRSGVRVPYRLCNVHPLSNTVLEIHGWLKLTDDCWTNGSSGHADASMFNITSGADNVMFDLRGGGLLDGNASQQQGGHSGGPFSAGIGTDNVPTSRVLIIGGRITNFENWPINITNGTNIYYDGVEADNSGNSVEFAAGTTQCLASRMNIHDISDILFAFYGGVSYCGIVDSQLARSTTGSSIAVLNDFGQPAPNHDILIAGNTGSGSQLSCIAVSNNLGTANNYAIRIEGNSCVGNHQKVGSLVGDIILSGANYVRLVGNQMHNSGAGVGTTAATGANAGSSSFTVASATGLSNGLFVHDSTNPSAIPIGTTIAVSGVTVTLQNGVLVSAPGVSIGDVLTFGPETAGIVITTATDGTPSSEISGECGAIWNEGAGGGYGVGVHLVNPTQIHLHGCKFSDDQVVPTMGHGFVGAVGAGAVLDNAVASTTLNGAVSALVTQADTVLSYFQGGHFSLQAANFSLATTGKIITSGDMNFSSHVYTGQGESTNDGLLSLCWLRTGNGNCYQNFVAQDNTSHTVVSDMMLLRGVGSNGSGELRLGGAGNFSIITNADNGNAAAGGGAAIQFDRNQNIIAPNLPTTCSGKPSKALWNNDGVVNVCP